MSLKNTLDLFDKEDMFQSMIIGNVIDNKDPMQQGRVKLEIPSFTEGISKDIIPWTHQLFPVGTGTLGGIPSFKVPAIGTQVCVIFPEKDIYTAFYIGELIYSDHKMEELLDDYPETYGFIDKIFNKYWINMKKKTMDFHHHTGTHLHIDDKGTMTLDGVKDLNINIERDTTIKIKGNRDETINKDSTLRIDGNWNISVGGDCSIDVSGKTDVKTGGSMSIESGGKMDIKAGGPMSLSAPTIDLN